MSPQIGKAPRSFPERAPSPTPENALPIPSVRPNVAEQGEGSASDAEASGTRDKVARTLQALSHCTYGDVANLSNGVKQLCERQLSADATREEKVDALSPSLRDYFDAVQAAHHQIGGEPPNMTCRFGGKSPIKCRFSIPRTALTDELGIPKP